MKRGLALFLGLAIFALTLLVRAADEDAASFVKFGEDFGATCVSRNTVTVTVKSTHPSRVIRVWLERSVGGTSSGDRSKSDLKPNAEPEDLGCARSLEGAEQKWKVQKAVFVEN